eukprot:1960857-Amphidinium_carterae.1
MATHRASGKKLCPSIGQSSVPGPVARPKPKGTDERSPANELEKKAVRGCLPSISEDITQNQA